MLRGIVGVIDGMINGVADSLKVEGSPVMFMVFRVEILSTLLIRNACLCDLRFSNPLLLKFRLFF
jgi:hypothetical protein